eukprot:XP_011684111.1 PREDICTED: solute carrier family 52, riboflavin transporter, member 3-like [Strongylocentrotus purpuratus]
MFCSKSVLCDALTALLVVTFGTSTWVSLGGLWVELPLLTNLGIPEGYRIGSYLIIATQAAAIGPLIFVTCQCLAPKNYHLEIPTIYATLAVGATASFLLIFFWDYFSFWSGDEHSIAFLILAFFMALVDSTSNLTFMPFISSLKSKYLNWYFIGEGLSSVIPSFVVLIQGTGGEDECVANHTFINITVDPNTNVTICQNCTVWAIERNGDALFPPQSYFIFIFVVLTLSTTSFCLLRRIPFFRDQYDEAEQYENSDETPGNVYESWCSCCNCCTRRRDNDEITPLLSSYNTFEENKTQDKRKATVHSNCEDNLKFNEETCMGTEKDQNDNSKMANIVASDISIEKEDVKGNSRPSKSSFSAGHAFLFTTLTLISALTYGVLPSIQGYSSAAYGSNIYLLATTFAEISVPIGFFLVMIRPTTSYPVVLLTSLCGVTAGGYCIVTASLSPTPPLQEQTFGQTLIVLAWIGQGLFFSYCRATIGLILRSDSGSRMSMMCFGGCTTIGTMVGAAVMFPLVNVLDIFKSFDPSQACTNQVTCVELNITDPSY